jgi:hypothetical protein
MIGEGDYGEIGGMKIGRGSEILGENLPQRHFVHHKSHMTRPGFEPEPPLWHLTLIYFKMKHNQALYQNRIMPDNVIF